MITEKKRKDLAKKLEGISATTRDKTVYATRYGLYDGIYKTLEETGKIFDMSRENVRVIIRQVEKLF